MNLVWKLLRQHISGAQLAGFFFANLVGMLIVLVGLQFFADVQAVYNGEDRFMKADWLIVNKEVGIATTMSGHGNAFSDDEIEDMEKQPFVERLGVFTSSAFDVSASFDMAGLNRFSTDMFFESVPDEFVDVDSENWTYAAGSKVIPIILPRSYLDLYNFGYAQSRGMPRLSEGILGAIKLGVHIEGSGRSDDFSGHIVGFSNRLNTILVPQSFMEWANAEYGSGEEGQEHSRLILQVNNPGDTRLTSYLQEQGYQTDKDKLNASKTTFILRLIVGIVTGIGLLISLLSFFILMLSIYLLVEKNTTKLENLLLIGYSTSQVAWPYQLLTIVLNLLVLCLGIGLMLTVRHIYLDMLRNFFPDFTAGSMWPAIAVGCLLFVCVSILNIIAIRSKVRSIWNNKS